MIKFRAYDKHRKVMCDVLNINFDNEIIHIKNPKTNEYWGRELKELNMLQFIGQNDSKGTKIYEGDIIETSENRWVVESIGSKERDGQIGIGASVNGDGENWPIDESILSGTVIGNIFLNPELLEN
ncbi:YopX family protein [Bacillus toyonensis]|uniref:YopX protein domain-containing protein n=1 Tax=Bacillus toyonensis TaxID=155322 RepID=A0A2B5Y0Q1_9BACI|nr:YopX family protein [Bacillus toyonensis]PGB02060.1 hypothetical protein COL93_13040 [Bacillus toyonensis]PHD71058.1 hypothetical protein COF40_09825 [Bacillus toyonensis]